MTSSTSSQKHNVKSYFEEITSFDLFYQLTYMAATATAGISRAKTFQLARTLPSPPARFFKEIQEVAENLRYNYPDAVRLVGEQTKAQQVKTFLLRLADALRSGEPLPGFLAREAEVQGSEYTNAYLRQLESLKKWNDAYSSISVSAALIVIITMVSTMIYNTGPMMMAMMVIVAVGSSFGVAWVLFRSAPQEDKNIPLTQGSELQKRSRRLLLISLPIIFVVAGVLLVIQVPPPWILMIVGIGFLPVGWVSRLMDKQIDEKDNEISSFLRSLGGTASSRGTTLGDALANMKIDSFPSLEEDIRKLDLRLKAFGKPKLCWDKFGLDTGSVLVKQAMGIFYESINLGGDPDKAGKITSMFSMQTAMLRAQRRGVAGTFIWLVIVMHTVMAGLLVFLLGVMEQFSIRLGEATKDMGGADQAMSTLGVGSMFSFNTSQIQFLSMVTIWLVILLAAINAFAVVASEGSHLIKITYYLGILLIMSSLCLMFVPSLVKAVM